MYTTSTTSGAKTATSDRQPRTKPLWVRAHHTPAAVRASPTTPVTATATLARSPIANSGTSTAAAAATKASRASQR